MDITFEEVAFVIQGARYLQTIFDTDLPKPEVKFPFIDFEDHQRDIIKVLQMQKKNNRISITPGGASENFADGGDKGSGGGCCNVA